MLVSLFKTGNAKLDAGDRTGALAAYQEAVNVGRKLAAEDPDDAQAQTDLALSLYKLGTAAEPPQARAALTEALAILEKLEQQQSSVPAKRIGRIWCGPHCRSWLEAAA